MSEHCGQESGSFSSSAWRCHFRHKGGTMGPTAETFREDCWVPPPDRVAGYRGSAFMRAEGIGSTDELFARAAREPEWFYPAAFAHVGIEWMRPWEQLVDETEGMPFARWFVGGGTNAAW